MSIRRRRILFIVAFIALTELAPNLAVTKPPLGTRKSQPIRVRKFECPGQPYPVTKLVTCRIRSFRNRPQEVDFLAEFPEPQPNILASFELFVQHQVGRTLLYGTTVDYCRTLDGTDGNKVVQILLDLARKNIPQVLKPCPYEGVLNATGVSLGIDMVPAFTLPGRYRADARWYNKKNQTLLAWTSEFDLNQ